MPAAPEPADEFSRLDALKQYVILDTSAEAEFDDFTRLASQICGTPIALISLIDAGRQWFKSKVGLEASETPREMAFCAHTILGRRILEIPNALDDERFRENPLVAGAPDIRFYAGAPLTTSDGFNIGTICVIDRIPRQLTDEQKNSLATLGRQVVSQLELRLSRIQLQRQVALHEESKQELAGVLQKLEAARLLEHDRLRIETNQRYAFLADAIPQIVWTTKADGNVDYFSQRWFDYTGLTIEQTRDWGWTPVLHPDDLEDCLTCWKQSLATGGNYEIEYRFKRADGVYRWHIGRAFPFRNEKGEIVQWVGTCTDIDDQKRSRSRLEATVKNRTAELAGARERLQAVLDAATQVAIIAGDVNGIVTVFNRGAEQMLGYRADEFVGLQSPVILHLETEIAARSRELSEEFGRPVTGFDVFVEKARHQEHDEQEWTYVRKDGGILTVNLLVTASRDASGVITGFLGIATDITARKKTEKKMRDQALMLDLANDTIFIRDREDRVTYWNRGAQRLYGWSSAEAMGRVTHELLRTQFPAPLSEIRTKLFGTGFWEGELVHTRRDGGVVTVASSWTLNLDETNQPVSVIEMNYDITDRKTADRELEKSRERLDTILSSSLDGVIAYESVRDEQGELKDFRFILINPAAEKFIRTGASDLIGQNIVDKFPNVVVDGLFEKFVHIVEKGATSDFEYCSTRTDPPRWFRITGVKLGDGLVISYAEITARKQYEQQLQAAKNRAELADRSKSDFLANMSHEIRTPMNGVIGMTGLLLETSLDSDQKHLAETIRGSAESLLGLLNDILDFSKIEAGKLSFEELDFDLRKVVEDTMEILTAQAEAKGVELVGGVAPTVPTRLRGDPGRVGQILTNLIGNAIKFTASGEVAVELTVESESKTEVLLRFDIRDTGMGVPPEAQGRLFQPFVQEDTSTSRKFGGTGLGLAICKSLAESMQGRIGLNSVPGKGSTFWVTMRFSRQEESTALLPDLHDLAQTRVLVVDDNETSRRFLHSQIVAWRMHDGAAATKEQALTLLRQAEAEGSPFSVALIDRKLGDTDGLDLVREINSDPRLNATRIVLLTPFGKSPPSSELKSARISACCAKPVRQSALLDCLVQVVTHPVDQAVGPGSRALPYIRQANSAPKRNERILLAEDNVVNQQVALGNLARLGYSADIATNGFEVLHALESKSYDIILMDCHMPELDGYEVTGEIRRREGNTKHTWIIAMTANVMVGDRERCLAAGMDDYLGKPLRRAELRTALEGVPVASGSSFDINYLRKLKGEGGDELTELIGLFIASAPTTMADLTQASRKSNAPALEMASHTLKGACANFGISPLREICAEIEQASKSGTLVDIASMIPTADNELTRFIAALKSFRQSELNS